MYKNDEGTINRIIALGNKYENAIPVFGGAAIAYNYIHQTKPDFESFIEYLSFVIDEAIFRRWHEGAAGACRTFCHLCLVDPMLVEAYLGMRFEQLVSALKENNLL